MAPYYQTLAIFLFLACCGCFGMPALVRAGCKGSVVLREKLVWRELHPKARAGSKQDTPPSEAAVGGAVSAAVGAVSSRVTNAMRAVGLRMHL